MKPNQHAGRCYGCNCEVAPARGLVESTTTQAHGRKHRVWRLWCFQCWNRNQSKTHKI